MSIYTNSDGILTIELPRMLGSRTKAIAITSELKDMLDGQTIEVIGTNCPGATGSFVDEFFTQIFAYRNAAHIIFINMPETFEDNARFFSIVRGYSHQMSFSIRN